MSAWTATCPTLTRELSTFADARNPLADLRNTRSLTGVWMAGVTVPR